MQDEAVAWASSLLDEPVSEVAELPGGFTSTMLALSHRSGRRSVLRLMTREPWRTHGADLVRRERAAQLVLAAGAVPAPASLGICAGIDAGIDAEGEAAGVAAHLMSRVPGAPLTHIDETGAATMAEMLALVHDVRPAEPFREYQSWAWVAKRVVPTWTRRPEAWARAFEILAEEPPAHAPTFLHRDFSHRNLLWQDGRISGVVDWVETSTGPAWLDAAHAATNLAVACGPAPATALLAAYASLTGTRPERYWLVMDVVGFLPPRASRPSSPPLPSSSGWTAGSSRSSPPTP